MPPVSGPRAAFRDLAAFLRQPGREKVWAGVMALLITVIILIVFLVDPKVNTAPPEQIVYVEDYAANRTDADIKADQKKDQAEREAFAKKKQEQFKQLEKAFHIQ
ncbi:hypothetical protein [Sphingomonas sp. ASV193]|uniref:hypothetical protein n=1 Tax=Sphingomonas sp. ASV193 TaxID=3144405 RepID=UPI0032E91213